MLKNIITKIFPTSRFITDIPDNLLDATKMAIRVMEGKQGKKVEFLGTKNGDGCTYTIEYVVTEYVSTCEVSKDESEIKYFISTQPEQFSQAIAFMTKYMSSMLNRAKSMGMIPKNTKIPKEVS